MSDLAVTFSKAIALFEQNCSLKNKDSLIKNLKKSLNSYIFEEVLEEYQSLSAQEFEIFLQTTPVPNLQGYLEVFQKQFDLAVANQKISENTRRTYQYPLKKFIDWAQAQVWYQELIPPPINQPMPRYRGVTRLKTGRGRKAPYMCKEDQLPEQVAAEIARFKEFWIKLGREAKRNRRGEKEIRLSTYQKVKLRAILCFFGWLTRCKGYDVESLTLSLMLDLTLVEGYIDWMVDERNCGSCAGTTICQTAISIAKFLSSADSQLVVSGKRRRRNWSDVAIIEDLRDIDHECQNDYRKEKKLTEVEKWAKKEISHQQAREVVQCLRQYLTNCYHNKRNRSLSAIWWDWLRYLAVKLLTYGPVRQQELRDLEWDKTIFRRKDAQGKVFYEVKYAPDCHKVGSKTYEARNYKLPDILTADLDTWFEYWKPLLEEALNDNEKWLDFWGRDKEQAARLKVSLANAKQGKACKNVKKPVEEYVQYLEKKTAALQRRINSREIAQQNFTSHQRIFILCGSRQYPESFGLPMDEQNFWSMVTNAVAFATQALTDNPKRTNPHSFRHIGDKHVRQMKDGNPKAFDIFIGHSEMQGDRYADQIMTEFEKTKGVIDSWWEE